MDVLQTDVHGAYVDAEFLEAGEEIKQVMRRQRELRRLNMVSGEFQRAKRQGSSQGRCRRGGASRRASVSRIGNGLATELEGIGQGFLMGADKIGKVLLRCQFH